MSFPLSNGKVHGCGTLGSVSKPLMQATSLVARIRLIPFPPILGRPFLAEMLSGSTQDVLDQFILFQSYTIASIVWSYSFNLPVAQFHLILSVWIIPITSFAQFLHVFGWFETQKGLISVEHYSLPVLLGTRSSSLLLDMFLNTESIKILYLESQVGTTQHLLLSWLHNSLQCSLDK